MCLLYDSDCVVFELYHSLNCACSWVSARVWCWRATHADRCNASGDEAVGSGDAARGVHLREEGRERGRGGGCFARETRACTCARISSSERRRRSPMRAVAQNLQPWSQPTWLLMHNVVLGK